MFSSQRSAAQRCGLVPVHLPVGQLESIRHCTALHCPCSTAALNQCVCAAVSTARDHRAVPFHSIPAACGSECGSPLCCRTARPRHAAESIHSQGATGAPLPVRGLACRAQAQALCGCTRGNMQSAWQLRRSVLRTAARRAWLSYHGRCMSTAALNVAYRILRVVCQQSDWSFGCILYVAQCTAEHSQLCYARSQSTPQHCSAVVRSRANPSSSAPSSPNFC
jgi:hypothetical protein